MSDTPCVTPYISRYFLRCMKSIQKKLERMVNLPESDFTRNFVSTLVEVKIDM